MRKDKNQSIWEPLLVDLDQAIQQGAVSNLNIYYLVRALHSCDLIHETSEDLVKNLVEYLVKRGYDSDDLIAMSSKQGGYRRAVHLIWLIADAIPSMKNKLFLTHI